MVDTNVLFQDSVRLVQRLIELRKENWSVAPYPGREPRLRGRDELGRRVQAHPEAVRGHARRPMTRDELLDLFRRSGALLEGHFRSDVGAAQSGLSAVRARAAASAHARGARPRARRIARARSAARPSCCRRRSAACVDRPGGRPRAGRARDLRRAAGRRARRCAAGFTHRRTRSRARGRGRADDRRLDARDDAGGAGGRRDRWSAPASIVDRSPSTGSGEARRLRCGSTVRRKFRDATPDSNT